MKGIGYRPYPSCFFADSLSSYSRVIMRGDMFSCPIANGCLIIRGLSYLPTSWNLKELIFGYTASNSHSAIFSFSPTNTTS